MAGKTAKTGRKVEKMRGNHSAAAPQRHKTLGKKRHYDEYMKLKDLEWAQNIRNERRDANIDEKYGTPIRFMEKNAKVIALVILLGLMMISVGITVLILKFR